MKCCIVFAISLLGFFHLTFQEEVRLIDLDPQDAQQIIEQQDTNLKYAPKIESNVPAVRYLGNKPHHVSEDIYLANQYHGQDGLGGYLYGYSVPDIAKTEKKKAGGDLRGAYNYIAGNGQEIKVEYWDDGTGFHQIDNVPKNLPEDLPEVKKAKEEFMRIWQEQAERNKHPVEDPYNSAGQYKEGPLSVQGQLHRQQQFSSQFGKNPGYQNSGGYQTAASQQSSIYQSNLERAPQTHNPNYQAYQGRDQQNQGTYQSKQFISATKGSSYGGASTQGLNPGGSQGYAKGILGGQSPGIPGNVVGSYGNQNQWSQPPQNTASHQVSYGGYQTQYQGQPSQNVNKYAQQPQASPYGSQSNDYSGKSSNEYSKQSHEDDGQYREGPQEQQGPPKGFFYKFDYPVGIIVSKQGQAQEGAHPADGYHHQHKQPDVY